MKLPNANHPYSSGLHHLLTFTTLIVSLACFVMFFSRIEKMNTEMENILDVSIMKSDFLAHVYDVTYFNNKANKVDQENLSSLYNHYIKDIFNTHVDSAIKYEEERFAESVYLKAHDKNVEAAYEEIGVNTNRFPLLAHSYIKQVREDYSHQLLILILIPTLMALLRCIQSVYYFYSLRRLHGNYMVDPLTGVYNRRYLSKLREKHDVCYILAVDIDNFKTINDTWGHAFGDRVLLECTNAMKLHLRDNDFVIRMGGDEFSIFLFKTDRVGAHTASSRLLEVINSLEIPLPDNETFTPSVSMGLARCTGNVEMALHQADLNLYASKKKGKNTLTVGNESREATQ